MEALERLSVISRVTTELANHWGVADRDLAEFVVHLGEESSSLEEFSAQLKDNGASVSSSLAVSLYTTIQKLSRKKKSSSSSASCVDKKQSNHAASSLEEQKKRAGDDVFSSSLSRRAAGGEGGEGHDRLTEKEKKFPGLCLPNDLSRPELRLERPANDAPLSRQAQKLLEAEKDEKELLKEQKEALRKKTQEDRHASTARAGNRGERGGDSRGGGPGVRTLGEDEGKSRKPQEEKREGENDADDKKPPAHYYGRRGPMIRYAIYEGVVEKVLEFGAFVRLEFTDEGTRQGLLHVVDMYRNDKTTQRPLQPQ